MSVFCYLARYNILRDTFLLSGALVKMERGRKYFVTVFNVFKRGLGLINFKFVRGGKLRQDFRIS